MESSSPLNSELVRRFSKAARAVSAVVDHTSSLEKALQHAVETCANGKARPAADSGGAPALQKTLAAPGLDLQLENKLKDLCHHAGIQLVTSGLRGFSEGIDLGFTIADLAIAETGTLILDATDEDLRLATMICRTHMAAVPISRIAPAVTDVEAELAGMLERRPGYLTFVTGASRTADIERVLALGVHGPLELHILLVSNAGQNMANNNQRP